MTWDLNSINRARLLILSSIKQDISDVKHTFKSTKGHIPHILTLRHNTTNLVVQKNQDLLDKLKDKVDASNIRLIIDLDKKKLELTKTSSKGDSVKHLN